MWRHRGAVSTGRGGATVSKSSANPRKYSRGRDAIDHEESCVVYVEIRCDKRDILVLNDRLTYLASRRPDSVIDVVGLRRETSKIIATLGVDMGPIGTALKATDPQTLDGYDLLWDVWENLVEFAPVFASKPGLADERAARALGFGRADTPTGPTAAVAG